MSTELECSEEWHCGCAGIALRLRAEVARLTAERDALALAARDVVHTASRPWPEDHDQSMVVGAPLIEALAAALQPPSPGGGAATEGRG